MPINIIGAMLSDGPDVLPGWHHIKTYGPTVAVLAAARYYFAGAHNTWERDMHGKVFLITGGTSGIGAQVAYQLATKGAQVILLVRSVDDTWLIDYIEDLRDRTSNFMIYAEACDLSSLHSVRKFATKWLDNSPPRRIDGIVCCAAELLPPFMDRKITADGVERQMGINYVAHFHLLTLLKPALTVQPPDRDVRVVLASCASQSLGDVAVDDLLWQEKRYPRNQPWKVYGSLKLLLLLFSKQYQKELQAYERKDKTPCNVRILSVNPGIVRTPSTRRFLSLGSIWGLLLFWVLYPVWFVVMKTAYEGSQLFMYAIFCREFAQLNGGQFISECKTFKPSRKEIWDEELQQRVFDATVAEIERIEKRSAVERARQGQKEKKNTTKPKNTGKVVEVDEGRVERETDPYSAGSKLADDVYTMPTTPEELEAKLAILRGDLSEAARVKAAKAKASKGRGKK